MGIKATVNAISLCCLIAVVTGHAEVSLSLGWHGRVEVKYSAKLGSVCDDFWGENDCKVVCRQLGYTGGKVVQDATMVYGEGTGDIWLDDVECTGTENYLDECQHDFWGTNNCIHKEDAGCKCDQPSNAPAVTGTCDPNLHKLVEFDSTNYPGIGRVQVRKDSLSPWQGVCDDQWEDAAAKVFCNCVGYTNTADARAFWSPSLQTLPAIPILYKSVKCDMQQSSMGNLHDCVTTASSGSDCGSDEAAAVACKPVPHSNAPGPPQTTISCNGKDLQVCFTSSEYNLSESYLLVAEPCVKAIPRNVTNGVCMDVDMEVCKPSHELSDASSKQYCYNISYSQYDTNPNTLLTDQVWTRRSCCVVAKNGTVTSNFEPLVASHDPIAASAPTTFTLECFSEETFSGASLSFPAQLGRGQDVFCRITAETWDPEMYLVVPDCKFMASSSGGPEFSFHTDKCPTSTALDLNYFSFNGHRWGFKFSLPKFQDHPEVYLSCKAYICDTVNDSKPYCDRSCHHTFTGKRKRRSATAIQANITKVTKGPFLVADSGFGPLILQSGEITIIRQPSYKTTPANFTKIPLNQEVVNKDTTVSKAPVNQPPKYIKPISGNEKKTPARKTILKNAVIQSAASSVEHHMLLTICSLILTCITILSIN